MQAYDLIMLLVLLAATAWGAWKGLAWQIASLASLVASYFVAYNFRDPVAQMIDATPPWNMFLAMLILFMGTSLVIWLAFRFVSEVIERVKLKEFDRQFGALLGLGKGILLCVIITMFAVTLLGEDERRSVVRSYSGHYIALLLDKADAVLPDELHEVLHPYIHDLDERLSEGDVREGDGELDDLDRLDERRERYRELPVSIPGGQLRDDEEEEAEDEPGRREDDRGGRRDGGFGSRLKLEVKKRLRP